MASGVLPSSKRASNRRRIWLAAAASLAIAGIGLWLMRTRVEAPSPIVASVSRTEGTVKAGPPRCRSNPGKPSTLGGSCMRGNRS